MKESRTKQNMFIGNDRYENLWKNLKTEVKGLLDLKAGCVQTPEEKKEDEAFDTALRAVLEIMNDLENE